MLKALLWDVDGTLAETELDGHLVAMNEAFTELGVPWRWGETRYADLLRVAGGFERLLHSFEAEPDAPKDEAARIDLARRIHRRKNELYVSIVEQGRLRLRPGVSELFDDCAAAGVRMAVVTTTSRGNVEALLRANLGEGWQARFETIVAAEDAPKKKPDPQAYAVALERLQLEPGEALAIEDSPAGLQSASAIGIPVVVARSRFFADADVKGAIAVGPTLGSVAGWSPPVVVDADKGRVTLAQLQAWHAHGTAAAGHPASIKGRGR